MKILYIATLSVLNDNLGVLKKIKGQAESMKSDTIIMDVVIFYKNESILLDKREFPNYFTFIKYPYSGFKRVFQLFNLWEMIFKFSRSKEYDVIYFRNPGSSYYLYLFLKKFKNKVILEHNSKELEEIKLRSKLPKFDLWKEVFFAKKGYKYALGNVGKATEFSVHQEYKVGYKLNLKTITNGVLVNQIQKKTYSNIVINKSINLIFVGNTAVWHGLERLLLGMKNYNGSLDYSLFLVGKEETFLEILNKLELKEFINKHIFLTGFKTGEELEKLFDDADCAIGSLGLHRINILNGVPLKHREYLSRGLPFIYSGMDEDIDDSISKYLFNIEANESPVDFSKLLQFINDLNKKEENVSQILTQYADKNIDMIIKSNELIDFIKYSINREML
ncbi:hypothetical protein OA88_14085 [Flavobacterium sp. JRM]|nr:hypothetical protein OA88_14085 [Flavobacterium sp. JRM]